MKQRPSYKSWPGLRKQLEGMLCDVLKGRISYFMTAYEDVHNSYGRASIRLDGRDMVHFTWNKGCEQEIELGDVYASSVLSWEETADFLQPVWNRDCVLSRWDFLDAVLTFRDLSIEDALSSDDPIVRVLAILDRRCGKRTLIRLRNSRQFDAWPDWARPFAVIRLNAERLSPPNGTT